MCGIAGIVRLTKKYNPDSEIIKKMTISLSHRGPDNQGLWSDAHASLGHARLSIIDLSETGNQPMLSIDGRYVLVYNGELYNYQELKKGLEKCGHKFRGRSDTEVLLQMLLLEGVKCLPKLNGIFAFALWDREDKTLLIARDRFGVKPLYFYLDENLLIFGSEIKAILASNLIKSEMNPQGLNEFCFFGNPLGRETLFHKINRVEPGQWLKVKDAQLIREYFWCFPNEIHDYDDIDGVVLKSRYYLKKAVERQLVSDVPVGVFLSGGIDSSAITAFATQAYSGTLQTFSAGFDFDRGVNELPLAKKISSLFGTEHHELHINGSKVEPLIEGLIHQHDEPFSDCANIPLYLLSKELGTNVPVILQGDGGDEIFGGYKRYLLMRYRLIWKTLALFRIGTKFLSRPIANRINRLLDIYGNSEGSGVQFAKMLTTDDQTICLRNFLSQGWKERLVTSNPFERYEAIVDDLGHLDQLQKLLYCDTKILLPDTFLEKVDKSTMAHSIEVRVPFLDNELTDYVLGLPSRIKIRGGQKKWLLKKALNGIVPNNVLYGPKKGFGVPFGFWLSGKLYKYARGVIGNSSPDLLDKKGLLVLLDEHRETPNFRDAHVLWKAINLSLWHERYIR